MNSRQWLILWSTRKIFPPLESFKNSSLLLADSFGGHSPYDRLGILNEETK